MELTSVATLPVWIGFIAFVLAVLALDLAVIHRKAHVISLREAAGWSVVWVSLSLAFNAFVWWRFGSQAGIEFLTGYLIEKSLSVDNIFVFLVVFGALGIPAIYQHRVLFWGILTALVLRAAMIFAGTAMLARFHWLMYVFGGFLVISGIKLLVQREHAPDPEKSVALRALRRVIPSTTRLHGDRFFTIENGRRLATPLFMTLVVIEVTDVVFAVDSIPAIFAVTRDPFIVFTSNICAILGLRSLFFLLAGIVDRFVYLKLGLAAVLVFVGAKMLLVEVVKLPSFVSLGVIAFLLGVSVVASLVKTAGGAPPALEGAAQPDRS